MHRLNRLAPVAAGTALILACGGDITTPGGPEFGRARTESTGAFTRCRPEPYASSAAWIGPQGGTLRTGRHVLKVPAGALSAATLITMESPSDTMNYVVFGPEGLTFHARYSPHLVMSYKNCSAPPGTRQQVVYVNDSLSVILETPSSATDTLTQTVDAKLAHFSKYVLRSTYAVAY